MTFTAYYCPAHSSGSSALSSLEMLKPKYCYISFSLYGTCPICGICSHRWYISHMWHMPPTCDMSHMCDIPIRVTCSHICDMSPISYPHLFKTLAFLGEENKLRNPPLYISYRHLLLYHCLGVRLIFLPFRFKDLSFPTGLEVTI